MFLSIILNNEAGSGHAQHSWRIVEAELNRRKINYELKVSKYSGHAEKLAFQSASKATLDTVIVVIGGDGTLHEVVNGLLKNRRTLPYEVPVGYVPSGSGNDFATALKMSTDPLTALNDILELTESTEINVGYYEESMHHEKGFFVNNIGVGFDAAIVSRANSANSKKTLNKLHLGSLSYIFSILSVLFSQDSFQLMVHNKSQHDIYQDAFLVTTSNHPYFGGGVPILPNATVHDPNLELIVIERHNWLILLWIALFIPSGKHLNSHWVHHYKSSSIRLTTTTLEFGQSDGEEMGSRFFDLEMNTVKYPFWIKANI
ncbi:diacylglycerol kinase family protein [Paucilactobacillus oligofermentans DSM 15707 = LMG 22743]|uniref:Diacylglycerol kinase family protein n=1 Tax=Paucilactobacillus oligofermentans DSM 15707 = LMG 22743 TaxID=1423778 RepID=A0A0R1RJZ5_9LACO|nr:diacylglycerol kinase family protein [Paucilactobacillus oligofermentans]KRL54626.1 diacylglycerol kinase family protein [Paucilactobacillus oligofermentans DSM 15707 = LMG 22743]CUS26465.1 Diacylglycerol kinase [Paucilactobacillus oligofermentans DSM 15707 = LMG 22743]